MKVQLIPIDSILPREKSQRTKLPDLGDLMQSIKSIGLINPIVLDENNRLVAGGCRLEAFRRLALADKKYSKIPVTFRKDMSAGELLLLELDENLKREELHWKDYVLAVHQIEQKLIEIHPDMNGEARAGFCNISRDHHRNILKVAEAILSEHPRISTAESFRAALNILTRENQRKVDNVMNELYENLNEEDEAAVDENTDSPEPSKPKVSTAPDPVIFELDFIKSIPTYNGAKYNLVHCDFPYGIGYDQSAAGGSKGRWDSYDDSPDVYWKLVETFCAHRERFMLTSCHIMFWLSARADIHEATRAYFAQHAPEISIDPYPLIWHKTDNKGIIRNIDHTPRHVYETALLMTRGERKIIKAVANTYGAPTARADSIHQSEKPVPMLRHFFQLFVDNFSEVFDPTCGSGSAMRAAHSLGAKRVTGWELNPEYAEGAQREFERTAALIRIAGS